MADTKQTGNVLLDAWMDALKPFMSTDPLQVAAATAQRTAASSPERERNFLDTSTLLSDGASLAGASSGHMAQLWSDLAQRSFGVIAALGENPNAGDPLGEALDKSFSVMADIRGSAAEWPALLTESTKAFAALCAARETYRGFMVATWQRAFQEVTREAARRAAEGKPVVSPAEWLSLANEAADGVFVRAFHSQPYLDAQRELSSALATQRRSELKLVELFANFGHYPTRRALDELSGEVHELRRRVRHLERASGGVNPKGTRESEGRR
ncbi:MAG: hypothetical protein NVS2B3_16690 [Vulcanimicrobiaceae bacterium]